MVRPADDCRGVLSPAVLALLVAVSVVVSGQSVTLRAGDHVAFENGAESANGSTLTVANE